MFIFRLTIYAPKGEFDLVDTVLHTLGVKTVELPFGTFAEARVQTDEAAQQKGVFSLNKFTTNAAFVANLQKTALEIEKAVNNKSIGKVGAVVIPLNTGAAAAGIAAYYKGIGEHGVRVVGVTCKKDTIPEMGLDLKNDLLQVSVIEDDDK